MSTLPRALLQPVKLPSIILIVDDEPQACKWFARLFSDEFTVLTAHSVNDALALLAERGHEVAVVLTDYRMPQRDGIDLLSDLRSAHPHISRLLISAYANKDVAMAAINRGHVEQILEKPLNEPITRKALHAALINSRRRVQERAQLESPAPTLQETLGFLAHEASAPLATVRGYLSAIKDRHIGDEQGDSTVHTSRRPGEFLAMIEAAQRGTAFAQSLVARFLHAAEEPQAPGTAVAALRASELVTAVCNGYPFDEAESTWVRCKVSHDFELPVQRDLLYLVLCTLVKNAVLALRSAQPPEPELCIELAQCPAAQGQPLRALISVRDNGPGISPAVLESLAQAPNTRRTGIGGNGMGLLFCQRTVISLGGAMDVRSTLGQGAVVTLYFPIASEETNKEEP